MPTDRNLTRAEVATYAEVLLSGAKSENAVFEVGAQLADVLDTVRGSMRLRDSLADPSLSSEARAGVVKELFKDFSPSLVSATRSTCSHALTAHTPSWRRRSWAPLWWTSSQRSALTSIFAR